MGRTNGADHVKLPGADRALGTGADGCAMRALAVVGRAAGMAELIGL